MTPTHEQVLAAIDKARPVSDYSHDPDGPWFRWAMARNAHCDDLRATAERHAPEHYGACGTHWYDEWPCPDYRQIIDRLTAWGMLDIKPTVTVHNSDAVYLGGGASYAMHRKVSHFGEDSCACGFDGWPCERDSGIIDS